MPCMISYTDTLNRQLPELTGNWQAMKLTSIYENRQKLTWPTDACASLIVVILFFGNLLQANLAMYVVLALAATGSLAMSKTLDKAAMRFLLLTLCMGGLVILLATAFSPSKPICAVAEAILILIGLVVATVDSDRLPRELNGRPGAYMICIPHTALAYFLIVSMPRP